VLSTVDVVPELAESDVDEVLVAALEQLVAAKVQVAARIQIMPAHAGKQAIVTNFI
jgi:hypothetical protein